MTAESGSVPAMVENRLAVCSASMGAVRVGGYLDVPLPGRLTAGLTVGPAVTGNRSLDEFTAREPSSGPADPEPPADGATPDVDDPDGTADDHPTPDEAPTTDGVEPVESTYDWTPGGAPCAACGAAVEERWRDGDDLVCQECKVW